MDRELYIERTAKAMYGDKWRTEEAQRIVNEMADKIAPLMGWSVARLPMLLYDKNCQTI